MQHAGMSCELAVSSNRMCDERQSYEHPCIPAPVCLTAGHTNELHALC